MSAEQDEAAVTTPEERAGIAAWADTFPGNEFADTIRRLLADLDAAEERAVNAENIARLAEESEAGWRREADELAERVAAVTKALDDMATWCGPYGYDGVAAFIDRRDAHLRAALTTTPTPAAEVGRREESGQ